MLPNPRIVAHVLLRGGAAAALPEGALWIDMSTSTPAAAERVAAEVLDARGVRRLDAPVSGMARGAEAGTLQIFVGGPDDDFRIALPVFEAMGDPDRILHVGPLGAGYTVKLMINLLWFSHLVTTSEVLAMGVKAGVDLGVLGSSLLGRFHCLVGGWQERLAGADPIEQSGAQFLLEPGHLVAERGLDDVALFGGAGEAGGLRHREHATHLLKIHRSFVKCDG